MNIISLILKNKSRKISKNKKLVAIVNDGYGFLYHGLESMITNFYLFEDENGAREIDTTKEGRKLNSYKTLEKWVDKVIVIDGVPSYSHTDNIKPFVSSMKRLNIRYNSSSMVG